MLLTRECDYGLRIIRALGDHKSKTVLTISEMEHVPYKYAYKILKKLKVAGFVQSQRGATGGYILVRPLSSLSIFDIANAIDERFIITECLRRDAQCPRNTDDEPCAVHRELGRIQDLLIREMRSKSVKEIVESI